MLLMWHGKCTRGPARDFARGKRRSTRQSMAFEEVLRTLSTASMASIAPDRTDAERMAIASFLTGTGSKAPSGPTGRSGNPETLVNE